MASLRSPSSPGRPLDGTICRAGRTNGCRHRYGVGRWCSGAGGIRAKGAGEESKWKWGSLACPDVYVCAHSCQRGCQSMILALVTQAPQLSLSQQICPGTHVSLKPLGCPLTGAAPQDHSVSFRWSCGLLCYFQCQLISLGPNLATSACRVGIPAPQPFS